MHGWSCRWRNACSQTSGKIVFKREAGFQWCVWGRQNIALLAVGSFTTRSSRFASYVTNGLSGVGKERSAE